LLCDLPWGFNEIILLIFKLDLFLLIFHDFGLKLLKLFFQQIFFLFELFFYQKQWLVNLSHVLLLTLYTGLFLFLYLLCEFYKNYKINYYCQSSIVSIFDPIHIGCYDSYLIIKGLFVIGSIAKCDWQSYRLFICSMCLYSIVTHPLSFLVNVKICVGMPIKCH